MLYMSADAATKSINDIEACRPKWRTSVWFPTANERCIASAQREEKELIDACCINVDHHMTQPWIELLGENFGSAYQWWRRGITNIDLVRQLIRHRVGHVRFAKCQRSQGEPGVSDAVLGSRPHPLGTGRFFRA